MNELSQSSKIFYESLATLAGKIANSLPGVLIAVLIFLVGLLIALLIKKTAVRLLQFLKIDEAANRFKLSAFLEKANIRKTPSALIGSFVYYVCVLLVIITVADTLGWDSFSNEISSLLGYLPKLFFGILFFIIGLLIASFIRDLIKGALLSLGIQAGKTISNLVFYFFISIIALTSLEQAGFDTSIITLNLSMILGAVLVTAAISYGFASRDILNNILSGYVGRNQFKEKMMIEVDGIKGEIIKKTNISVILELENKDKVVIPIKTLINNKVRIIGANN